MSQRSNKAFRLNILLAITALLLTARPALAGEEKENRSKTPAHDAVEAACAQAAKESKRVFLKSGFPSCIYCLHFDAYHDMPEVRKIIEKYYVVVAIDTELMKDGNAVFSQFAQPGGPSWVIITPEKKVIVDSFGPDGNVGYPGFSPKGRAYYLDALKKATPAITDDELRTLSEILRAYR